MLPEPKALECRLVCLGEVEHDLDPLPGCYRLPVLGGRLVAPMSHHPGSRGFVQAAVPARTDHRRAGDAAVGADHDIQQHASFPAEPPRHGRIGRDGMRGGDTARGSRSGRRGRSSRPRRRHWGPRRKFRERLGRSRRNPLFDDLHSVRRRGHPQPDLGTRHRGYFRLFQFRFRRRRWFAMRGRRRFHNLRLDKVRQIADQPRGETCGHGIDHDAYDDRCASSRHDPPPNARRIS